MVDFSSLKIPVIEGINDIPLEPNFNGNGKGCNGAFFMNKFHAHVDLTEANINDLLNSIQGIITGDVAITLPTNFDGGSF